MTEQEFNSLMKENEDFFWMSLNDVPTFLYEKGYEREEVIDFLKKLITFEQKEGRMEKTLLN